MSVDLSQDYFSLFGLAPSYAIDDTQLAARFRELQREYHPDRFASGDERQKRLAVQQSAFINQAFEALTSPVARAQYLLQLAGVEAALDGATTTDAAFLLQQMEWREALMGLAESAAPLPRLEALKAEVESSFCALQQQFDQQLRAGELAQCQALVARLQFVQKLLSDIESREEALWDA